MIGALGKGMLTIADGPEMPSIDDFLPDPFVFQGTPFAINRIILVRILATVIMLLVLGITASRAKLIPSRWQGAVEWLIEFVRDNIVYQVMGEYGVRRGADAFDLFMPRDGWTFVGAYRKADHAL